MCIPHLLESRLHVRRGEIERRDVDLPTVRQRQRTDPIRIALLIEDK